MLSLTTWLAPGLPFGLFDAIADAVSAEIGVGYELSVEPKISGPTDPVDDRFEQGVTDIGFLCPPSYVWLRQPSVRSVLLAPYAPVFDDPRNDGRPVYFSDLVVRSDSGRSSFDDLAGARVGFNDRSSLSGYFSVLHHLDQHGSDPGFFGSFEQVGSHANALDLIAGGHIDAAAIDANVLRTWCQANPESANLVHSIAAIGPHPVQPIVVRRAAADQLMAPLLRVLTGTEILSRVAPYGVAGFAPIADGDFDQIEPMMELGRRHQLGESSISSG